MSNTFFLLGILQRFGGHPSRAVTGFRRSDAQQDNAVEELERPRCRAWLAATFVLVAFVTETSFAQSQPTDQVSTELIRGVVSSKQSAELRVNLRAQVARTPFKTGESFRKGDTLLLFDCSEQKADVAAAYAGLLAAKANHESNLDMLKHQAIGQFDVDLSATKRKEWTAIWRAAKARTKNCDIKAPYDGRVAALHIHAFETPVPEQPLIKIVGTGDMELQLVVPSTWLRWIAKGAKFEFQVDETGTQHTAKVVRVGAEVDAVSRTVDIFGAFDQVAPRVLPGMSGSARFSEAGS